MQQNDVPTVQLPVDPGPGQYRRSVQPEEGGLLLDQPRPHQLRVVRQPPLRARDRAAGARRQHEQVQLTILSVCKIKYHHIKLTIDSLTDSKTMILVFLF